MSENVVHSFSDNLFNFSRFIVRSFVVMLIGFICFVVLLFCFYFVDLSFNDNPLFGFYVIATPSMVPSIEVNDGVIIQRIDYDGYNIGDIITFSSPDERYKDLAITHRIIDKKHLEKGGTVYQTKGDNNDLVDSSLVNSSDIYGKVLFKIPKIGYVQKIFANPVYYVVCFLSFGTIFIFYELYRISYMLVNKKIV